MNDFDELLDEVLHRDANPQPPADLKKAIVAGLRTEQKHTRSARSVWVGIAAAVIVGLATWTLTRTKVAFLVDTPSEKVAQTRPNHSPQPIASHHAASLGLTPRVSIASPPHSTSQRRAVQIAPLKVEPIAIQPIEIASISTGISTTKGKIR